MNKCKANEGCDNNATYDFHGTLTCYKCLYEHISAELIEEAIDNYIDFNADKLNQNSS